MKLTTSIVICTKKRLLDLRECVGSIMNQTSLPAELVIVDGSENGLVEEYVEELQGLGRGAHIDAKSFSGLAQALLLLFPP
jgi:glycosyltransferase involved in cell wall biosynthesis